MNLASAIKSEGRALPVFLVVDVSGSMAGDKIGIVNTALREMLATFRNIKNPRGIIKVCLMTFGGSQANVIKPLSTIGLEDAFDLTASGSTPMGSAFEELNKLLNDKSVVSSRDYTPTVILISDGQPTDFHCDSTEAESIIANWPALASLLDPNSRSSKVTRLAMGIGADANYAILKAFVNNPEVPVIRANDNGTIANFFNWVTMSVSTRSVNNNPNDVDFEDFKASFDDDSIVL